MQILKKLKKNIFIALLLTSKYMCVYMLFLENYDDIFKLKWNSMW